MSAPKNLQSGARSKTNRRLFWLSFFVAAVAALFGWSAAENASDLRTCELAVGALNNDNDKIEIKRVSTASFARVVRIDYDVASARLARPRSRFVSCRFLTSQAAPYRAGLTAIDTEAGPLPDSNLYLMRRFYLDTGEARKTTLPFASARSAGLTSIAVHALQWLVSVLSQAAIYGLLASLYLCFSNLFNATPRYREFHGAMIGLLAMAGVAAMTGALSPLALAGGLVCDVSFRLINGEQARIAAGVRDVALPRWVFFSIMIGLALFFWQPVYGVLSGHWLPFSLFQPIPLFVFGGQGVSTTPLTALLIMIVILCAIAGIPGAGRNVGGQKKTTFQHTGLILVPVLAGAVVAFGFLQYGTAANPFLLGTKAALIALIVMSLTESDRHLTILPVSLAVVSFEYAIAPFVAAMTADAATYSLLVAALFVLINKKPVISIES